MFQESLWTLLKLKCVSFTSVGSLWTSCEEVSVSLGLYSDVNMSDNHLCGMPGQSGYSSCFYLYTVSFFVKVCVISR